jgi:hypothetical protein
MQTHTHMPAHSSPGTRRCTPVSLALLLGPGSVGRPMPVSLSRLFVLALPLVFAACRDPQVASYRIPKEKEPEIAPAAAHAHSGAPAPASGDPPAPGMDKSMANTAVATASGPGLAWVPPGHWEARTSSAMRKGSYAIPGEGGVTGDFAITAFPGDVGGEVANVNRWRGQIQLPSISEEEVAGSITRLEHNGLEFAVVDIASTGATPTRVLGAWVPYQGSTWFFKLTGPDALVAKEKAAFLEFLQTVKPSAHP